jgi:hypothetical protein
MANEDQKTPPYVAQAQGMHMIDVLALDSGQPHWLTKKTPDAKPGEQDPVAEE